MFCFTKNYLSSIQKTFVNKSKASSWNIVPLLKLKSDNAFINVEILVQKSDALVFVLLNEQAYKILSQDTS